MDKRDVTENTKKIHDGRIETTIMVDNNTIDNVEKDHQSQNPTLIMKSMDNTTKVIIRGKRVKNGVKLDELVKNMNQIGGIGDGFYGVTIQSIYETLEYLCYRKYPKKQIHLSKEELLSTCNELFECLGNLTLEYDYYHTASLVCIAKELKIVDYEVLAKRLLVEGLELCCGTDLKTTMNNLYYNGRTDSTEQKKVCGIRNDTYQLVMHNLDILQGVIINENNDKFTYFGLRSMVDSYLIKSLENGNIPIESPQLCYMRIAADIMGYTHSLRDYEYIQKVEEATNDELSNGVDLESSKNGLLSIEGIIEIYKLLSCHKLIPPSPHFFGVGQYASCFLVECGEDTLKAITKSKNQLTDISKGGGGVGLTIDVLRASGRPISSTGGRTSGLIGYSKNLDKHNIFSKGLGDEEPDINSDLILDDYKYEKDELNSSDSSIRNTDNMKLLKSFDSSSTYIDQGRRRATYAIYISTHHQDFEQSIKLKDATIPDDLRTLNLYYCGWNSDLLMERVQKDEMWSFFSPDVAPGLHTLWGTHFRAVYEFYESKKLYSSQKRAREFWKMIMESIMGFSACYLMYKDACNRYCNENETIPKSYKDHFEYWLDYEREHELKCRNTTQFCPPFESDITYTTTIPNKGNGPSSQFYIDKLFDSKSKQWIYSRIKELEDPNITKRTRFIKTHNNTNTTTNTINDNDGNSGNYEKIVLEQGGFANIRLSNLCTEVLSKVNGSQDESKNEIGVCNLCSINLSKITKKKKNEKDGSTTHVFDYDELLRVTRLATLYLNRAIDRTLFPNGPSKLYCQKRRSIGIGVAGLATLCSKLGLSMYEDVEQVDLLNFQIFETMYYASLKESNHLAKKRGHFYETFKDSPLSKGLFIFDLFDGFQKYKQYIEGIGKTVNWDFESLRKDIVTTGVINSQNLCVVPNATSASALGISENVEPLTSNLMVRNIISGSFVVFNPRLLKTLKKNGLWNHDIYSKIVESKGNIKHIHEIPTHIKRLFPTVWENTRNLKRICDLYIGRQWFISNAQSLNFYGFHGEYNFPSAVFYLWKNEAKNGVYYYRTKRLLSTQQFSIDINTHEQRIKSNDNDPTTTPTLYQPGKQTKLTTITPTLTCNQEVCFSCQ